MSDSLLSFSYQLICWIFEILEHRKEAACAEAMEKNPEYCRAQTDALVDARLRLQEKYNKVKMNKLLCL